MILLTPHAAMPLYQQLYTRIREQIQKRERLPGDKLPSKRKLAAELKISQNTVAAAYDQLLAEGYIYSRPKSGFYVANLTDLPVVHEKESRPAAVSVPSEPVYRYDFKTNTVDDACFPFPTWAKLSREVLSTKSRTLLQAVDPGGYFPLRQVIADYVRKYRGVHCLAEQVIIGAGSEYLLSLVIQLLGRDRIYAIENPAYSKIFNVFKHNDVTILPVSLDEKGLSVDALRQTAAEIVHLTPSHHFPLGTVMPVGRRLELLKWATEAPNRYLIEDDYDSEYRFTGKPVPALQGLDSASRVIYFNTFTRSLAPSMRISYMILPKPLLIQFQRELSFYSSTVPRFEQHTLHQFIAGGHYERHLNRMRKIYKSRCNAVINAISHLPFSDKIHVSGQKAGLHLILSFDAPLNASRLKQLAEEKGIHFYSLSDYYLCDQPSPSEDALLLGYAHYTEKEIYHAFSILEEAWRQEAL